MARIRLVRAYAAVAALWLVPGATAPAWADAVDDCETAGYFDRAVQLDACTAVIEQDLWPHGDMAWVYSNRGNAYAALGQPELALDDYAAALRIDPGYAQAYSNRGAVLLGQAQYEAAIADFDAALQRDLPANVSFIAHYNRAIAYCRLGDGAAAQADWTETLDAAGARGRARVQSLLSDKGHPPGSYDGTWTDASQAALDAWVADGCP